MSARRGYPELNRKGFVSVLIILLIISIITLGAVAVWQLKPKPPTKTNNQNIETSYASQEECEAKTGKTCGFAMCDVVPAGKTFEETCGKGFKAGWKPKNQSPAPSSANETANWKIYTNVKLGFSIKYPSDFKMEETTIGALFSSPDLKVSEKKSYEILKGGMITVDIKGENYNSLDEILKEYQPYESFTNFQKSKLGTLDAWRFTAKIPTYPEIPTIISLKNGKEYSIQALFSAEDKEVITKTFNQILSTFQFLN